MKNYTPLQLVLILAPFVFSFAFGLDIYIPIVPQMIEIFQTTPFLIQLTLSLFLFVTGVGQLLIGPLSDQFGRKRILLLAAASYALGSLACAASTHIAMLLLARILCSLGACGLLVTSFALVRDLFSGEQSAKMFSFLHGSIGISPIFAPLIGGYLATFFGWRSIFIFLTLIGLFAMYISQTRIEETHHKNLRTKVNKDIFKRYWEIFSQRQFLIYALIAGLAESVFFCFFSISPFIIIDTLGVSTQNFGYYFATFGSVIAFGGLGAGKTIEKIGIQKTIFLGISLMLLGGVSMLGCVYFAQLSLSGFLIPMVFACTGAMFLLGSAAACALEPFGHIAGTASAAFGSLEFGIAAIIGSIVMSFSPYSTIPYGVSIVVMGVLSLGLFWPSRHKTLALPTAASVSSETI
jgi:Bcr/CflA subfamily drug resistance transporter